MAEENNDANADPGTGDVLPVESAGSSPDTEKLNAVIDDDGLISTVDFKPEKAVEAAKPVDSSDGAEHNTPEDKSSEKQDFNEHPRFKELIDQKNAFKAEIERQRQEIENLKRAKEQPEPIKKEGPAYDNILNWEDDVIIEKLTNSPKELLKAYGLQLWHEFQNQQAIISNSNRQQQEQRQQQDRQRQVFQKQAEFFSERKDAADMLNDGRIKEFLDSHPEHNPISAYFAIAGENIYKDKIDAAVKAAQKETEEKIYKQLKAKGHANSNASTTPGRTINDEESPEVKNPEKFGGAKAVAVARFMKRQSR